MSRTNKIKQRLVSRFAEVQHAVVCWLNIHVNQKTRSQKTCGLILFSLLFGTVSICLIIKGMTANHPSISLERITRPSSINGWYEKSRTHSVESPGIRNVHRVLDSLHSVNPKGYDSLVLLHPFLMDSLKALDSIYSNQNIHQ